MRAQDFKVTSERFFGMLLDARGAACDEDYITRFLLAKVCALPPPVPGKWVYVNA